MKRLIMSAAVLFVLTALQAEAQTLRLRQADTGATRIEAAVGETIVVEVVADAQGTAAAGISFFLSIQGGGLVVVDGGQSGEIDTQPFTPGPQFGSNLSNILLSETADPIGRTAPGLQLDYAAILPEDATATDQLGVVAVFRLYAESPVEAAQIIVDDNPIRESRLIGADRVSERRFATVQGLEISVVDPTTAVDAATWGVLKQSGN